MKENAKSQGIFVFAQHKKTDVKNLASKFARVQFRFSYRFMKNFHEKRKLCSQIKFNKTNSPAVITGNVTEYFRNSTRVKFHALLFA